MTDFLIVGGGLAGMAFAETVWSKGQSVVVFDGSGQNASRVASGLYNPVVLKRLTAVSGAVAYLDVMEPFYSRIQARLQVSFFYPTEIWRRFNSIEEQNNWFVAADNPKLAPFLSTLLIHDKVKGLDSPFDYGLVNRTGWLDTKMMLNAFWQHVPAGSRYITEAFDYTALSSCEAGVRYKDIQARHVIFAEGIGLSGNPFFKNLPLQGTKGELLYIKAPQLKLKTIVNAGIFIMPIGNSVFKVGATYAWDDLTDATTESAKAELIEKLEGIISVPYEIVSHLAGIRPTVRDRKPLLGTHSENGRYHIFNGLGTRGILLAPRLAKQLYDAIENGENLPLEIDIRRFKSEDRSVRKG